MYLEIVTPDGRAYKGDVSELAAPGYDGEFGVLPGHTPYLTLLEAGELTCKDERGLHRFAVSGGFIEVSNDKVAVVVDNCERAEDLDLERAKRDFETLQQQIATASAFDDTFRRLQLRFTRARARIQVGTRGKE